MICPSTSPFVMIQRLFSPFSHGSQGYRLVLLPGLATQLLQHLIHVLQRQCAFLDRHQLTRRLEELPYCLCHITLFQVLHHLLQVGTEDLSEWRRRVMCGAAIVMFCVESVKCVLQEHCIKMYKLPRV